MRKSKKKMLEMETDIRRLTMSIDILNQTVNRQNRAIRFLSTHSTKDIVIRPNSGVIEVEYCGPSGFNIAIFIDSYLLDHINDPIVTHSHNEFNAVFSSQDQIYVLDKVQNSVRHVVEE